MKKQKGKYDSRNKLNNLTGSEWLTNSTSVWLSDSINNFLSKKDIKKLVKLFTKEKTKVGLIGFNLKQASIANRKIEKKLIKKTDHFDYIIINNPFLKAKNIEEANELIITTLNKIIKDKIILKKNKYITFFIHEQTLEGKNLNISNIIFHTLNDNGFRFKGRVNIVFSNNSLGFLLHFKLIEKEKISPINNNLLFVKNNITFNRIPHPSVIRSSVKTDTIGKLHPAPFSPSDIQKLIQIFTKEGETVFDPFVGVGSTTIASLNSNRKSIGIDLNKDYIKLAFKRAEIKKNDKNHKLIVGDSLKTIKDLNTFNYCVTSPPYHNILKNKGAGIRHDNSQFRQGVDYYSEETRDLGNQATLDEYRKLNQNIMKETYKKLSKKSYTSIVISDFTVDRVEQDIVGLLISDLEKIGFAYSGLIVLTQNNKAIFPFGYPYDYVINHVNQYIINFYKH